LSESDPVTVVISSLLKSGFPFQTAVAKAVQEHSRWDFRADLEEMPWRHPDGTDQFLDMVAIRDRYIVTIECKKSLAQLTFLTPDVVDETQTRESRCLFIRADEAVIGSGVFEPAPKSHRSMYCCGNTQERPAQRLEGDIRMLLHGTNALAKELEKSKSDSDRVFVPVLVTTASLFTLAYNPNQVDIETGELPPGVARDGLAEAPWVRFQKAFLAGDGGHRTVFVVHSGDLGTFLDRLEGGVKDAPRDIVYPRYLHLQFNPYNRNV